ncbi:MAG: DUF3617 family protein [Pseudomonadota bacterium]
MRVFAICVAATALFASAAQADPAEEQSIRIEPGLWAFENTMAGTATLPNGASMAMPARTTTDNECITPEKAEITPERMLREMRDGGGECEYGEIVFAGLTMSTTISCVADGMRMAGDYSFEVAEDRRSGTGSLALNGVADGMTVNSTFEMSGKLTGPCS